MKRAFITFLLIHSIFSVAPTNAGGLGRAITSHTLNSAAWGVVAVENGQTPTSSPFVTTWTVSGGTAYDYFDLRNIGTVTVNGVLALVNQTRVGSGPTNELFFERCINGSWNISSHTCSGSVTQIGKASDKSFTLSSVALAPSSAIQIRARTPVSSAYVFTTTISTYINRSDIRGGQVTNS